MDDITPQQIQQRYLTIPQDIRTTLANPETYELIEKTALRHELTRVEAGLLAQVTSMLMMGFIKPNEYIPAIMDQLSISREQSSVIAQELNHSIFNSIKDSLVKVHAHAETSSAMQRVAATIPGVIPSVPQPITQPLVPQVPKPITPTSSPEAPKVVSAPTIQTTPRPIIQPDPSPRSVATPPSTLATKLGNTYRVEPTLPTSGIIPGARTSNSAAQKPVTPTAPMRAAQEVRPTAPQTPIPTPNPIVQQKPSIPPPPVTPKQSPPPFQPVRYVPPNDGMSITPPKPFPSTPPVSASKQPQPTPKSPTTPQPPTQPAKYYPPAPPK